jgi:hypothetical protein
LIDRSDETVATSRKSLNESRILRGVSQGLAKSLHSGVYTMLEVDESIGRPKLLSELFPAHHFAGVF